MRTYITTFFVAIFSIGIFAQPTQFENTQIVNGFANKISGNDFSYHSSIPLAKECLLIRATNGKSSMDWETAPAPLKIEG